MEGLRQQIEASLGRTHDLMMEERYRRMRFDGGGTATRLKKPLNLFSRKNMGKDAMMAPIGRRDKYGSVSALSTSAIYGQLRPPTNYAMFGSTGIRHPASVRGHSRPRATVYPWETFIHIGEPIYEDVVQEPPPTLRLMEPPILVVPCTCKKHVARTGGSLRNFNKCPACSQAAVTRPSRRKSILSEKNLYSVGEEPVISSAGRGKRPSATKLSRAIEKNPFSSVASRKSILECDVTAYDMIKKHLRESELDSDLDDNLSDNDVHISGSRLPPANDRTTQGKSSKRVPVVTNGHHRNPPLVPKNPPPVMVALPEPDYDRENEEEATESDNSYEATRFKDLRISYSPPPARKLLLGANYVGSRRSTLWSDHPPAPPPLPPVPPPPPVSSTVPSSTTNGHDQGQWRDTTSVKPILKRNSAHQELRKKRVTFRSRSDDSLIVEQIDNTPYPEEWEEMARPPSPSQPLPSEIVQPELRTPTSKSTASPVEQNQSTAEPKNAGPSPAADCRRYDTVSRGKPIPEDGVSIRPRSQSHQGFITCTFTSSRPNQSQQRSSSLQDLTSFATLPPGKQQDPPTNKASFYIPCVPRPKFVPGPIAPPLPTPPPLPLHPPPTAGTTTDRLQSADEEHFLQEQKTNEEQSSHEMEKAPPILPDEEEDLMLLYDDTRQEHIYEELPDLIDQSQDSGTKDVKEETTTTSSSASTPMKSFFEGASKAEILNYLEDAKERGVLPPEDDVDLLEEIEEEDEEDEEEAKETVRNNKRNRISNISNSSCESSEQSSQDEGATDSFKSRSSAEIERNDSGVGAETSKPQRRLVQKGDEMCADCDQEVEPTEGPFFPLVCKKCEKKRSERKDIITEIVDTELKYGRDLRIVREEFYRPMEIAGLLGKEQLRAIFLNLEELIKVNIEFSEKLQDAVEIAAEQGDEDYTTVNIGKLFLESSTMLHTFETYCVRQGFASVHLHNLEKEKELLRIFLRVSQMENTLMRRMNLSAFLMVPVQRVTKYPLLLSRLYKVTPYHHQDREALREAQQKIEIHLEHINQQTKGVGGTKIWRRISNISTSHRRQNHLEDIGSIKLRKMAMEVLKWSRDEVRFVMAGKMMCAHTADFPWSKKGRTLKFLPVHALLVTLGKPNGNYRPETVSENTVHFPRNTGIRDATLLLIKEKNGRLFQFRSPLHLAGCVISCESEDMFEVQEYNTKEAFLFKSEDGKETKEWLRQLRYHAKDLGHWRRRRNALANIMINGMVRH